MRLQPPVYALRMDGAAAQLFPVFMSFLQRGKASIPSLCLSVMIFSFDVDE